jgi:hypothetical protein
MTGKHADKQTDRHPSDPETGMEEANSLSHTCREEKRATDAEKKKSSKTHTCIQRGVCVGNKKDKRENIKHLFVSMGS